FDFRTMVERVNARLKDEFGARFLRVRGAIKVKCHLMFGVVALVHVAGRSNPIFVFMRRAACRSWST
ncbi:MAG: hypothetical protein WAU78_03435, partial [Roseiarcus sp.]